MKKENVKSKIKFAKGFTLLELLVVVVIIGILASIALPKYQLAVYKSKYSAVMNIVNALGQAQEEYYLIHDTYTSDLNSLSIEKPSDTKDYRVSSHKSYTAGYLYKGNNQLASYVFYHKYYDNGNQGRTMCITYSSNKDWGDKLCKSFGGTLRIKGYDSCGTTGDNVCNQYILHHN